MRSIQIKIVLTVLLIVFSSLLNEAACNTQPDSKKEIISSGLPDNSYPIWRQPGDMDNIYRIVLSGSKANELRNIESIGQAPFGMMKKFDDYGHLRFGRSGSDRLKYSDPDYGHMRFGK